VYSYGGAQSYPNTKLDSPAVTITATPTGKGYYIATGDGGVYTFGNATFHGSTASTPLPSPITAITATPDGHGYWLLAKNGAVYPFGDADNYGNATAWTTSTIHAVGLITNADNTGYSIALTNGTATPHWSQFNPPLVAGLNGNPN
jgi:hypothetical protein